ncbi:MAG: hypothetical protein HYY06_11985 [Deltaproteobacteria bacterium]|nr:hypothetical protein [Deltaproteobacteria bacterium]
MASGLQGARVVRVPLRALLVTGAVAGSIAAAPPAALAAVVRVDLRLGASLPVGSWTRHALADTGFAPDSLTQFGPGMGGQLELGLQGLGGSRWSVGLVAEATGLSTVEWEDHAGSTGTPVDAWAAMYATHLTVGYRLVAGRQASLDASIGLGFVLPFGGEEFFAAGREYTYSFLDAAPSSRLAIAAAFLLGEQLDMVAELSQLAAVGGVDYRDDRRNVWSFGLGLGLRWSPGGRPAGG